MYPLAHIVFATALARAGECALRRPSNDAAPQSVAVPAARLDYRLVALGAWLPDIIDKPVAWWSIPHSWPDDHLFAHTLVFALMLCVLGAFLAFHRDFRILAVGMGVLAHRVCDPLFLETGTLFWPLTGVEFHKHTTGLGLANNLQLDALAALALGLVLIALWRNGRLPGLIREGRL